jgi:hypothetical protein
VTDRSKAEQIELLERAIKASGLSARRYAREVLIRDERTIRRWLAGQSPIPGRVLEWLAERQGQGHTSG